MFRPEMFRCAPILIATAAFASPAPGGDCPPAPTAKLGSVLAKGYEEHGGTQTTV